MCKSNSIIFKSGDNEQEGEDQEGIFFKGDFKKSHLKPETNNADTNEVPPCISAKSPTKKRGCFF